MNILKQIGWYAYASLVTVLTLGLFLRFHLVTVRKRTLGGVRAGFYGGTHVYREMVPGGTGGGVQGSSFLVISTWHGKERYPVSKIAHAQTGIFSVSVESSGGRTTGLGTWQTRSVAAFINAQVQHTA